MKTELVVAILGAGGLSAIIAAVVTGLFSKRKLGAEAAEIITKAAAGVVTNLQAEIDRQVELREDQAVRFKKTIAALIQSHATELREVRRVLQAHSNWDAVVTAKMAEVGIALPPAPPLLPIQKFDHTNIDGLDVD